MVDILCAALVKVELATDDPGMHRVTLNGFQVGPALPYDRAMRRAAKARALLKSGLDVVAFMLGMDGTDG
jgi:hypothetical protein